jgi:hypothetical protein
MIREDRRVIGRPKYRDVGFSMITESLKYGGASVIIGTSLITENARGTSVPADIRDHPRARSRRDRRPREL